MTGEGADFVRFVLVGGLNRDYLLPLSGTPQLDVLGGHLAYAAVGLAVAGETAGLMARVDNRFPLSRLDRFAEMGFNLEGIKVIPQAMDARRFFAYADSSTIYSDDPVQHFSQRGLAFPVDLLSYQPHSPSISSRTAPLAQSVQISDVPEAYLEASAVHIAPLDYLTHMIIPSVFRQGQTTTLTLSSTPGYMTPSFWEEVPGLISDLTAFITSEGEIRNLFQGRSTSLEQMAEQLGDAGPEFILIRRQDSGSWLYDRSNHRHWMVPDYPARVVDPTGADDAFAGGFLAAYRQTYDPVESVLQGAIAASLVVEGSGVYYALDAMPGLVQARRSALRELIRQI